MLQCASRRITPALPSSERAPLPDRYCRGQPHASRIDNLETARFWTRSRDEAEGGLARLPLSRALRRGGLEIIHSFIIQALAALATFEPNLIQSQLRHNQYRVRTIEHRQFDVAKQARGHWSSIQTTANDPEAVCRALRKQTFSSVANPPCAHTPTPDAHVGKWREPRPRRSQADGPCRRRSRAYPGFAHARDPAEQGGRPPNDRGLSAPDQQSVATWLDYYR